MWAKSNHADSGPFISNLVPKPILFFSLWLQGGPIHLTYTVNTCAMSLLRLSKATIPIPLDNLDPLYVFLSSEPRLLFPAQPCNCSSIHYPRSPFPASGRARKSAAYYNHTRPNITNFRRPFPAKYLIPPKPQSYFRSNSPSPVGSPAYHALRDNTSIPGQDRRCLSTLTKTLDIDSAPPGYLATKRDL